MEGSRERVRRCLLGERPDRPPLFDLLPNDVVLAYFNGGRPVAEGDDAAAARAVAAALDGSRRSQLSPRAARTERLADGRQTRIERWTSWRERVRYGSSAEYAEAKRQSIRHLRQAAAAPIDAAADEHYQLERQAYAWFGDDFCYLLAPPHTNLMGIWEEVGLEPFSYYLYDCEPVIVELLDAHTEYACRWIEGLPADDPFDAVFIGEDIAFKGGPMIRVSWLRRHYFPRLARLIAVIHARGKKVMFHSDGNLNAIMDDLVDAGIDLLNPVEIAAGMDLAELHRRYPRLLFAGGIDVTYLLPFGTPAQIRDAVVKAIEDTEGRIMVGSSTEVFNTVPLANYLALREAALSYRYG